MCWGWQGSTACTPSLLRSPFFISSAALFLVHFLAIQLLPTHPAPLPHFVALSVTAPKAGPPRGVGTSCSPLSNSFLFHPPKGLCPASLPFEGDVSHQPHHHGCQDGAVDGDEVVGGAAAHDGLRAAHDGGAGVCQGAGHGLGVEGVPGDGFGALGARQGWGVCCPARVEVCQEGKKQREGSATYPAVTRSSSGTAPCPQACPCPQSLWTPRQAKAVSSSERLMVPGLGWAAWTRL